MNNQICLYYFLCFTFIRLSEYSELRLDTKSLAFPNFEKLMHIYDMLVVIF